VNKVVYFDQARVALVQDSSSFYFKGNKLLQINPVSPNSKLGLLNSIDDFLLWVLNTHEESHNTIVQVLENRIGADRSIGFLKVDNQASNTAMTLEYRGQLFDSAFNLSDQNLVKVVG
jgi:hypothetical protein